MTILEAFALRKKVVQQHQPTLKNNPPTKISVTSMARMIVGKNQAARFQCVVFLGRVVVFASFLILLCQIMNSFYICQYPLVVAHVFFGLRLIFRFAC